MESPPQSDIIQWWISKAPLEIKDNIHVSSESHRLKNGDQERIQKMNESLKQMKNPKNF